MELQRTRVDGSVLIYEVRLAVNLAAQTIEQVIAKRRALLGQMQHAMSMEISAGLKGSGFEQVSVLQLSETGQHLVVAL